MADTHAIAIKNGVPRKSPMASGKAVTFMAKWDYGMAGNSSHIHQSLWSIDGKTPRIFFEKGWPAWHVADDEAAIWPASSRMPARSLRYLAPYINSYKPLHGRHVSRPPARCGASTTAPPASASAAQNSWEGDPLVWSAASAAPTLNPYLAFAALIAAGLDGIEKKMELEPVASGDVYDTSRKLREILEDVLPRSHHAAG